MSSSLARPLFFTVILILLLITACNFLTPGLDANEIQATSAAMTLSAYGTLAVLPPDAYQTAIHSVPDYSVIEGTTPTAEPLSAQPAHSVAGSAVVLKDALCYRGPGVGGVISSLKGGETVVVIAQGYDGMRFDIKTTR